MYFLTIFHFEQSDQEKPQTAETKCMVHGCELACINKEAKPETKVDGAQEDGFEFLYVEKMPDFLGLVFGNSLFVHDKGDQVKGNDKKPPAIFGEIFHPSVPAHDPARDGSDQQYRDEEDGPGPKRIDFDLCL